MRRLTRVGSIFLLAFSLMMLSSCGAKSENKKAEETSKLAQTEKSVLRVGMEAGYAPYNWTQKDDSNGAVKIDGSNEYAGGYDVEMAKKLAEALGKELVIVKTEWDGLPPAVMSDKIDVIMAGMSPTKERQQQIDFTKEYWVSDYVMIVKKDSKFANATSLADFKDAKVTGQLNTVHYTLLDQIEGAQKQQAMQSFPEMRVALQSGVIDAYVGELPEGLSVEAAMPEFKMVKFEAGKGFKVEEGINFVAAGVKKGNTEIKNKADEVFGAITEEQRQQIMNQAIKNQPAQN